MPGPGELRRYVNAPPPAAGPPGSRPGFCPLQVCINGYLSQNKKAISASVTGTWLAASYDAFMPHCIAIFVVNSLVKALALKGVDGQHLRGLHRGHLAQL